MIGCRTKGESLAGTEQWAGYGNLLDRRATPSSPSRASLRLAYQRPTDKIMLSLTAFADELEREKARQGTYDAMQRKANAGHVTGGACFGYGNVEIIGIDGKRSHVERQIDPSEAETIRRIFQLSAEGYGFKAIAKRLNAEGTPSPRAQQGRSQSWAPTSVRSVLFRALNRGQIVWSQTRKRDTWGRTNQTRRPEREWICRAAPDLQIVTDAEWVAAHARLTAARSIYLHINKGQAFGRPALGNPSKYLLTNLALCGCCGGSLKARSTAHGNGRKHFYGCGAYHERGRTVCGNKADVPWLMQTTS
jgi:site-specific DNA recombinase